MRSNKFACGEQLLIASLYLGPLHHLTSGTDHSDYSAILDRVHEPTGRAYGEFSIFVRMRLHHTAVALQVPIFNIPVGHPVALSSG
jgi:hypothetical protein